MLPMEKRVKNFAPGKNQSPYLSSEFVRALSLIPRAPVSLVVLSSSLLHFCLVQLIRPLFPADLRSLNSSVLFLRTVAWTRVDRKAQISLVVASSSVSCCPRNSPSSMRRGSSGPGRQSRALAKEENRGRERERKKKRNCLLASHVSKEVDMIDR